MERVGNLRGRGAVCAAAIAMGAFALLLVLQGARSAAAQSAQVGTIEIVKKTAFGDATFGYTTTTSQGGGGLPVSFELSTSNGTASSVFEVIGGDTEPITYTVTESGVPDGWEFDDLVCTDAENGDSGTTVNVETATATIVMNGGERVECTFRNERVRVTPTITTEIHDDDHEEITSAPVGSIVHDEAEVSGPEGTPTGEVDFRVWLGNTTCSGDSVPAGEDVELEDGVAHPSDPVVVPPGGLSFRAEYDGDSTYDDGESECEPLRAEKVEPRVTTEIHDDDHEEITSAPVGSVVHDEAEVSGPEGTPTGEVEFRVWLGNTTCSGDSASAGEVELEDGVAHPSDSVVVPPGGLSFRARYEGDSTYDDESSACEPLEAEKLEPRVRTQIHDEEHEEITSAPIGSVVHDRAVVSGEAGTPGGEVDFRVWLGNTTCSGDSVSAGEDVELEDGVAHPSDPVVVPPGGLSFRAQYGGDARYEEAWSPCEPLAAVGGTIIVEKQTTPDGAAATFAFSGDAAGSIADNGRIVVSGLAPGTYTSTEAVIADWILTSVSCDDANSSGNLDSRTATFRLAAGETVTCTFTNAQRTIGSGAIDVQKSASPATLQEPGGAVTFSVTITNTSNVNLAIENIVDDKFGDLDDEGGNGCFDAPINLAPENRVNCTFQRAITGPGGTIHIDTVTASGHDEFGNAVSDSDDARVEITPRLIDLVIVKEATSPTPLNGIVNYSLAVTNNGPDPATNVQVADPAPAGIAYLSASPSQGSCSVTPALVTCSLGTIDAGHTVRIAITARATTIGSHTNTATATGSGGRETNPADNVDSATTVVPAPLRPPTAKPKPAPKPEPCVVLTVSPKMIKADGKPDRVTVRVTAGKRRMRGVKVIVRGSGVRKTATSDNRGVAALRINPRRAGIITITARDPNRDVCGPKRIGVVGVFLPPVTG
jgi:uncharacterized repeat protein (TIGR01451 family)